MSPSPSNRIYPLTRTVAGLVVPILVLAFLILYFYPDTSADRFAWGIKPHMMALYIGAGYLGGAYLFLRVLLGGPWHRVTHGFLPVITFTISMLLLTILHWNSYDIRHFPFQLWLILYVITPVLIPWLWLRNRGEDPGTPEPRDAVVPQVARIAMTASGVAFGIFSVLGFIFPDWLVSIWVWALMPRSARALAGWFALLSVGGLTIGRETRWSAWKTGLISIFIWHALVLIGAFFNIQDFGEAGLFNWYLVLLGLTLAGMVCLYIAMEYQSATPRPPMTH